jgi:hypothetical protein
VVSEIVQIRQNLSSEKTITVSQEDINALPATPVISSVTAGDGQLTVSWGAAAMAAEYAVYHSISSTPPDSPSETINDVTTTISGLTNGTKYYVWVKALNQVGSSGFSAAASGTPHASQGTDITLTLAPQNDVTMSSQYSVIPKGDSRTFGVTGNYTSYKWCLDGTAIPGATDVSYTLNTTGMSPNQSYELSVVVLTADVDGESLSGKCKVRVSDDSSSPDIAVELYKGGLDAAHKIGDQKLAAALSYIQDSANEGDAYYIVLGASGLLPPTTLSYSGKTVGITLKGKNAEQVISLSANGSLFTVGTGVTLTLDDKIALAGISSNDKALITVSGGTLVMNDGSAVRSNKINTDDSDTDMSGGVYVDGSGTFTMNGGKISGNTAERYGGGVYVLSSGTFTMNGGELSGNTAASRGGGVYAIGTFTMNGGKISGNTASSLGGGV